MAIDDLSPALLSAPVPTPGDRAELLAVLRGVTRYPERRHRHDDPFWYADLFSYHDDWEPDDELLRTEEHRLALLTVPDADLRATMVEIVERLIGLGAVRYDDEDHAGAGFAVTLALADPGYVPLYARHLVSNDLTREVYQSDDIDRVLDAWGWRTETYPLFWARMFTPGRHPDADLYGFIARGLPRLLGNRVEADRFLAGVRCLSYDHTRAAYLFDEERIAEIFATVLPGRDRAFARAFVNLCARGTDLRINPVTLTEIEAAAAG